MENGVHLQGRVIVSPTSKNASLGRTGCYSNCASIGCHSDCASIVKADPFIEKRNVSANGFNNACMRERGYIYWSGQMRRTKYMPRSTGWSTRPSKSHYYHLTSFYASLPYERTDHTRRSHACVPQTPWSEMWLGLWVPMYLPVIFAVFLWCWGHLPLAWWS